MKYITLIHTIQHTTINVRKYFTQELHIICVVIMPKEMLGFWNYTFDQQPGFNWMNRKFSMYNSHFSLLFVSLSLFVLIFPLCFCILTIHKSGVMNDMCFTKTISRGAVNKEIFWIVLMALLYLWLPNFQLPSVCSTLFVDI